MFCWLCIHCTFTNRIITGSSTITVTVNHTCSVMKQATVWNCNYYVFRKKKFLTQFLVQALWCSSQKFFWFHFLCQDFTAMSAATSHASSVMICDDTGSKYPIHLNISCCLFCWIVNFLIELNSCMTQQSIQLNKSSQLNIIHTTKSYPDLVTSFNKPPRRCKLIL